MNSLNGRLQRLEDGHQAPETASGYTMQDFAGDVLEAIADGHICDWADMPHDRDFDYTHLLSPTVADGLADADRNRAYGMLNEAQKTVAVMAKHTGWRSPAAIDTPQEWMGVRANSVAELRGLMGEVLHYASE